MQVYSCRNKAREYLWYIFQESHPWLARLPPRTVENHAQFVANRLLFGHSSPQNAKVVKLKRKLLHSHSNTIPVSFLLGSMLYYIVTY